MNIEINLEDVFGPPRSKKACVHCTTITRLFIAADHIHVGVRTCTYSTVYTGKQMAKNLVWFGELERKLAKSSKTTFIYRSSS